ncbi:MAG: hypothetical protein M0P91_05520 [Sulfuricurvum sp.]|jgi:hypothetical protein|uniref:hypothetical protein n=1 Tax=Sulfuricurvum sp. TaxID=2025608 RepID=UPI0025DBF4EB|nr:hypothetical protein [Sulfuricurvum sp.]MCK9372636.1 hypothetical protein [Sulfuricurvum sp.]
MKSLLPLWLAITLFAVSLHAKIPENKTIIAKMIKGYGGEKNLRQLNDYEQIWHIETKTTDSNGTDKRAVHLPFFLKTELIYPNKTETRTLINDYGTKQFGEEKMEVRGAMLDAMKLQLIRLFHPLVLKEKMKSLSLSEVPEYYVLTLHADHLSADYFVSKKSYLIEKVVGHLQMGEQNMEFVTLYEEYKPINGVMLPHTETKYAGNVNTAVMRLKEMKFIPSVQSQH